MTPIPLLKALRLCRSALLAGMAMIATAQAPTMTANYNIINAGTVVAGTTGGFVTVSLVSDIPTASNGTTMHGTTGTRGSFTTTGKNGDAWTLQATSANPVTLNRAGGGSLQATVDVSATGTFPAAGNRYLGVRVTIGTGPTTTAGTYTGSVNVRVRDTTNGRNSPARTFTVTVKVDPVISLTSLTDMRFGEVITGTTSGYVVLSTAGARQPFGGVTLGTLAPFGAATFTVGGLAGATYGITIPTGSITLTATGGSLTIDSFNSLPNATGLLGAGGTQPLAIGGTLRVGANQVEGDYRGSYSVTVAYN